MSIRFTCTKCGKLLSAADGMAGRKARCTDCDAPLVVPLVDLALQETVISGESASEVSLDETVEAAPPPSAPTQKWDTRALPPEQPKAKPKPKQKKAAGHILPDKKHEHDQDLIDMTAMVDIVFFLLIFFLVTSMQAMMAVLPLPKPEQAASDKAKPQTVAQMQNDPHALIIKIEEDDSILVDDEEVYGEDALKLTLKQAREERAGEPTVLVIGHPEASHGAAVRVLDACASAELHSPRFFVQQADDDE